MELIENKKPEKMVRIIIGTTFTNQKGVCKPTKSMSLTGTDVDEVFALMHSILSDKEALKKVQKIVEEVLKNQEKK